MRHPARWYLPVLLISVYPVVTIIGANLGTVPLTGVVLARSLAVSAGAAAVILMCLRVLQRDLPARAAWLTWLLLIFAFYPAVLLLAEHLGYVNVYAGEPRFAISYGLMALGIGTAVSRPWKVQPRDPTRLTILAAGLLAVTLAPGLAAAARERAAAWRPAISTTSFWMASAGRTSSRNFTASTSARSRPA